MGIKLKFIF